MASMASWKKYIGSFAPHGIWRHITTEGHPGTRQLAGGERELIHHGRDGDMTTWISVYSVILAIT